MANLGTRNFAGSSAHHLEVNFGSLASQGTTPGTWLWAGRVVALSADAEIASTSTFDPLDFYLNNGFQRFSFYNGAVDDSGNGPSANVGSDIIVVLRLVSTSTACRWSSATHNGSVWSSFTHANGNTFTNRSFAASGDILFSPTGNPFNGRMALFGHSSSGALTDGDIGALTTDLDAWTALPSMTHLWDFYNNTDLVGNWSLSGVTGTTTTATNFPLDDGGGGGGGTATRRYRRRPSGLIYR